jgi:hypothetical protein
MLVTLYKPEVLKPEQDPVKPKVGIGIMFDLASLQGDPLDIAAVARRVVHAHLVSMQTHRPSSRERRSMSKTRLEAFSDGVLAISSPSWCWS